MRESLYHRMQLLEGRSALEAAVEEILAPHSLTPRALGGAVLQAIARLPFAAPLASFWDQAKLQQVGPLRHLSDRDATEVGAYQWHASYPGYGQFAATFPLLLTPLRITLEKLSSPRAVLHFLRSPACVVHLSTLYREALTQGLSGQLSRRLSKVGEEKALAALWERLQVSVEGDEVASVQYGLSAKAVLQKGEVQQVKLLHDQLLAWVRVQVAYEGVEVLFPWDMRGGW